MNSTLKRKYHIIVKVVMKKGKERNWDLYFMGEKRKFWLKEKALEELFALASVLLASRAGKAPIQHWSGFCGPDVAVVVLRASEHDRTSSTRTLDL